MYQIFTYTWLKFNYGECRLAIPYMEHMGMCLYIVYSIYIYIIYIYILYIYIYKIPPKYPRAKGHSTPQKKSFKSFSPNLHFWGRASSGHLSGQIIATSQDLTPRGS